jgi:hypothetical protein
MCVWVGEWSFVLWSCAVWKYSSSSYLAITEFVSWHCRLNTVAVCNHLVLKHSSCVLMCSCVEHNFYCSTSVVSVNYVLLKSIQLVKFSAVNSDHLQCGTVSVGRPVPADGILGCGTVSVGRASACWWHSAMWHIVSGQGQCLLMSFWDVAPCQWAGPVPADGILGCGTMLVGRASACWWHSEEMCLQLQGRTDCTMTPRHTAYWDLLTWHSA